MPTKPYRKDNVGGFVNVPAGGSAVILSVTVTPHAGGSIVFTNFGQQVQDVAALSALLWSIRVNGAPHADYHRVREEIGLVSLTHPILIEVYPGSVVDVFVENPGGIDYTAAARLIYEESYD